MNFLKAAALVTLALSVSACTRTVGGMGTSPSMPIMVAQPSWDAPLPPITQPQVTAEPIVQARLDPGSFRFIDGGALSSLSPAQRSAATDAQFYALQFGRPGAPRSWSAGAATGQVSVGPYVRVNNLDCREFTHRVTISGQTYTKSGTACREVDGNWGVQSA